jgi:UDP-glucose 4-epimerase
MATLHQQQNILVTGGAGFIGTHLCRKLIELGHRVKVLDLRAPETTVPGVEYHQGDVRDLKLVSQFIEDVSTVYHLAAIVSVPLCQRDPLDSYSNNFTGTLVVLEAIRQQASGRRTSPIRMVFASTAALYGTVGDDGRALQESDAATVFASFYAAQKYASEQAMDQYLKAFGVPSIAFRFFNVFGPGQDPTSPYSGVITIFSRLAKEGKPLPLNAGGIQTRDFITVYDIVTGLTGALNLTASQCVAQAVNLGTGNTLNIRCLAEIIRDAAGTDSPLVEAPAREGDVVHSKADIQRARQLLGFNPQTDLKKSLEELLKVI